MLKTKSEHDSVKSPIDFSDDFSITGPIYAVWKNRTIDRTPLEVVQILYAKDMEPAFLFSGGTNNADSRYSIIALEPSAVFRFTDDIPDDPFARLHDILSPLTFSGDLPQTIPFVGGWMGYFSYDLAHRVEQFRTSTHLEHRFPLIELKFYRNVLTFDHLYNSWTASRLVSDSAHNKTAEFELYRLLDIIADETPPVRDHAKPLTGSLKSNFSRQDYETAVNRVLDYISAGDIYQANLSQKFEGTLNVSPFELALRLFEANPAPYSSYISFGNSAIVSSSPESFLKLRNNEVETMPIKGTRPRGSSDTEDNALREELLNSEKDCAELTMITDLLRNDLGRVCRFGSVKVNELRTLQTFAYVHHTYSRITGTLCPEMGIADLLRATMPGGSITGAPKIRAMEIIEELEPTSRGPYCGAIGYIGVDGTMELNIAIRTILCEGNRLSFQVGGGIVADSQPDDEYEETLHKAKGMMKTLNISRDESGV